MSAPTQPVAQPAAAAAATATAPAAQPAPSSIQVIKEYASQWGHMEALRLDAHNKQVALSPEKEAELVNRQLEIVRDIRAHVDFLTRSPTENQVLFFVFVFVFFFFF